LRLLDVKRSCKKLGIDLLEGEYDFENWMQAVKGLENEPEKGARCEVVKSVLINDFLLVLKKLLKLVKKRLLQPCL